MQLLLLEREREQGWVRNLELVVKGQLMRCDGFLVLLAVGQRDQLKLASVPWLIVRGVLGRLEQSWQRHVVVVVAAAVVG